MWDNLLRVDWGKLTHAYGRARDVPKILRNMIALDEKTQTEGWSAFWGSVNHQGDFYDSTVAAIPFLVEAVGHPDVACRVGILNYFRSRWLDAPQYGGDPMLAEPPGGINEPTPMVVEAAHMASAAQAHDEPRDEDFDTDAYRSMDLCAWQTGRAIAVGRPTYVKLLEDPKPEVAAAAAALLQLWLETRGTAKRTLVRTIEQEHNPVEQARRILEFGVYGANEDAALFATWVAPVRPAEMRAAAALAWAWMLNPAPLPEPAAVALQDTSVPDCDAFARLPWEGVYHRGPWILPANVAQLILRLAENQEKTLRWRALQGLAVSRVTAQHLTTAQVVPVLVQSLTDKYNRIRDAAAYALAQRGEPVFEVDPHIVALLLHALRPRESAVWGDSCPGLDEGASTCGHAARLLALGAHRLTAKQREDALAGIDRAIEHYTGLEHSYVNFDSMGIQTAPFLKEQRQLLQQPLTWGLAELLATVAFPDKQDKRLPLEECDRRLAEWYARSPSETIAAVGNIVRATSNRNAAIGGSLWLATLGPAAEPALASLDAMANGPLDDYAHREAQDAAATIRRALLVLPEAQKVAEMAGACGVHRLSELRRVERIPQLIELLEQADPFVRAEAADLLKYLPLSAAQRSLVIPRLEEMLTDDAAVEVGIPGQIDLEGRLYHWRLERQCPRAAALRASMLLDHVPAGDRLLSAMLAESQRAAVICGKRAEPLRFSIAQWRLAVTAAGGLAIAEPIIRAARQRCHAQVWSSRADVDRALYPALVELTEIIRQLSGRLV